MIRPLLRFIQAGEKRSRQPAALAAGAAAIAGWLFFAGEAFAGRRLPANATVAAVAGAAALLALLFRLHASGGRPAVRLLQLAGFSLALLGTGLAARAFGWPGHSVRELAWLAAATGVLIGIFRLAYFAAGAAWPGQPAEPYRWLLLGGFATALLFSFYRAVTLGAGDAYWYTIMLADFTEQLRAGVFPVWVGQTQYAFNGAVSPLRLAPWFQHAGGLRDLLTWHTLAPVALKNAVIAVNGLAVAFSTYGCLRVVLSRRPGLAAVLAALWLASPGVLAPLFLGDMIMTFMAMVFLPVVVLGCWLVWTRDGFRVRVLLAAGLSGTWLSHTPIALWCSLLAATVCLAKFFSRKSWRIQLRRGLFTAALFLLLGSLPLLSVLSLDNVNTAAASGAVAAEQVALAFPRNFLPIAEPPIAEPLPAYQVGYAVLGAFALALLLLAASRPRPDGGVLFAVLAAAPALFVLPLPGVTAFFWTHVPSAFVTINNIWPMQRLASLWAFLMFFSLALVLREPRFAERTWVCAVFLFVLAGSGAWSWHEGQKLSRHLAASRGTLRATAEELAPNNLTLTRYAYTSFSESPGYYSHGFVDYELENRLLDFETQALLVDNGDYAAPAVHLPTSPAIMPRFVQGGDLIAISAEGEHFTVEPALPLQPGIHYALRLEFARPGRQGLLYAIEAGMKRQYLLPDSGVGSAHASPARGFGSLDTSGRVISLTVGELQSQGISLHYMGSANLNDSRLPSDRFVLAHYWLYAYTAADLPISVRSLVPYRAAVESGIKCWLETPRMWLTGYRATVNGAAAEVRRSPNNLVMIALPPGHSDVSLRYSPRWWLAAAFWLCLGGWLAVLSAAATGLVRQAREFRAA
jgi:hypothetical protein